MPSSEGFLMMFNLSAFLSQCLKNASDAGYVEVITPTGVFAQIKRITPAEAATAYDKDPTRHVVNMLSAFVKVSNEADVKLVQQHPGTAFFLFQAVLKNMVIQNYQKKD
jgi:hypothetical protein